MFARLFSVGIVMFWLIMTGLMIKRIHFPGTGPTSTLPVTLVLDTFFGQDRPGGQFDLLQGEREIGIVTIIPRERVTPEGKVREVVLWNGGKDLRTRWNAIVTLSADSTTLAGLHLEVSVEDPKFEFVIQAKPESETIDFVVRRNGRIIADSNSGLGATLQEEAARSLLSSWGFAAQEGAQNPPSGGMKAYEQMIEIAGRQREVYSIVASLGPDRDITIHFTRAGELLRIRTFLGYELKPAAIIID